MNLEILNGEGQRLLPAAPLLGPATRRNFLNKLLIAFCCAPFAALAQKKPIPITVLPPLKVPGRAWIEYKFGPDTMSTLDREKWTREMCKSILGPNEKS
jgi:hypothetical protein